MIRIIADSSSLILLTKCGLIGTVCVLFDVIVPPAAVMEVASEKLVKRFPDAAALSDLIEQGKITVQSPGDIELSLSISIHQGEREALALAQRLEGALLATDDGKAIKAAKFLKIPFIITPKIVTELFRLGRISFKKGRSSLEILGKIGRYSPEILADALALMMEEKDGKADHNKNT